MNDEHLHDLEKQLAACRPAPLPAAFQARLEDEPQEESLTFGDRVLATFSGLGAMAAAVILALTLWQLTVPKPPAPGPAERAAQQRLVAEYQQLLAAR